MSAPRAGVRHPEAFATASGPAPAVGDRWIADATGKGPVREPEAAEVQLTWVSNDGSVVEGYARRPGGGLLKVTLARGRLLRLVRSGHGEEPVAAQPQAGAGALPRPGPAARASQKTPPDPPRGSPGALPKTAVKRRGRGGPRSANGGQCQGGQAGEGALPRPVCASHAEIPPPPPSAAMQRLREQLDLFGGPKAARQPVHRTPPPKEKERGRRRGDAVFRPPAGPPRERDSSPEEARLAPSVRLRPYQIEGAAWLSGRRSGILADEPGVGKTPQAVAAIPEGAPVLIVCPAVARDGVWPAHVAWRPDLRSRVNRRRADFAWPSPGEAVIVTYQGLPEWLELHRAKWPLEPPDELCVVLDEGHLAKNPGAKQSRRVRAACEAARDLGGRSWLLTGHPLKNHPIDLWHLLGVLGLQDQTWRTKSRFCRAFGVDPYGDELTGDVAPGVPAILRRVMLRREFVDVVRDMPPRQWEDLRVEIDEETARVADAVAEALAEIGISLEDATRAALADQEHNTVHGEFMRARALLAAAKVPALLQIVEAHHQESDRPLVVFSAHRGPLDAVCASFEGWERISGSESPTRRAELAQAFQAGELRGVAVTIGPVSTAISLSAARRAIFVDLGWTPSDNEQAEGRIFRADERTIGTGEPVLYSILVADHPVDRTLSRILSTKRATAAASVGAAAVRVGELPDGASAEPSQRAPEPDAPTDRPQRPAARAAAPWVQGGQPSTVRPGRRPAQTPVEFWAEESLGVLAAGDVVSALERPVLVRVAQEIGGGLLDSQWRALVAACRRHVRHIQPPPSAAGARS